MCAGEHDSSRTALRQCALASVFVRNVQTDVFEGHIIR